MKVEHCLPDKPEILAMSAITGFEPDLIVGKCIRLWRWFDQHTQDGNATGVTLVTLGYAIGNGESSAKFINALHSVGWLIEDAAGVRLPNFDRHNGETSKARALTAKRVAKHKAKSNEKSNANGVTNSVTLPLPREEKRREDVNTSNDVLVASEKTADDALPDCPQKEILAAYAELLPDLPQPRVWEGARMTALRHRWRWVLAEQKRKGKGYEKQDGIDFFRRLFGYVAKSDFLCGRTDKWVGADLAWLVKAENFAKVLDGRYHAEAA